MALKCLIAMLPVPPKRGAKVPKSSLASLVDEFYTEFEAS